MPDLISVISRRWKLIALLTIIATALAFLLSMLSPKLYVGEVTALPANSLLNDKARIFNQNIEALYAEVGLPDELDKIEGTAKLDTLFLAVAGDFKLIAHYGINEAGDALQKAALTLKKNSLINRTGYGELKIKVWDKDNVMAANLANALLQKLNDIHQHLQSENNQQVLQKLKEEFVAKQMRIDSFEHSLSAVKKSANDTVSSPKQSFDELLLPQQLTEYAKLINEYELAVKTTPKALLVVEPARPSPWADKPKTGQIVVFAFFASLLFAFLLALFVDSRNRLV